MSLTRPRARRKHGIWTTGRRFFRYRLVIPVFRTPHAAEHTARGVANSVFWGLTPSVGLQTGEILLTWLIGRKVFRKESSLLQAFVWVWINNPVTMIPMYSLWWLRLPLRLSRVHLYVFYLTGLWLLGDLGLARGYDAFVGLWDGDANDGWLSRLGNVARAVGVPTIIGCVPYATIGSGVSYRWTVRVIRRRRQQVRERQTLRHGPAPDAPLG
ncbi:MAG TPA: DUF2062 domain-containing protein [Vicinamibacterales bacterium]|nr:DUF2062 domain-containing protein [Vicinamibacterales bacterium]